jgi:hypothetical protein
VRAQAASRPDRLGVRAELGLRQVVGLPVGVQLAGERVPVSGNVGSASLHVIDRLAGWSVAQTPTNGPHHRSSALSCHIMRMDGNRSTYGVCVVLVTWIIERVSFP